MERVLIISYIISMILMVGFIYCVYREKYWVFEFVTINEQVRDFA